jgi:hypothetical protein
VVVPGIIAPFRIEDQGLGEGTDCEEAIPSTTRPRAPGACQAEDRTGLPQADVGNEGWEADASGRRGAGAALILVDDGDLFRRPPQSTGALDQIIVTCGTGGVFPHVDQGGLPYRDKRPALKRVGANFGGWIVCSHRTTPSSVVCAAREHTARPEGPGGGPRVLGALETEGPTPAWAPQAER